jgi:hypothetical protein
MGSAKRSSRGRCLAIAAAVANLTSTARAETPEREGFTLELGAGPAFTSFSQLRTASLNSEGTAYTVPYVGLNPIAVSAGGFFTRDLAGMGRITNTSFFRDGEYVVNTFFGPAMQYWFADEVFVGGGVGLGIVGAFPPLLGKAEVKPKPGYAFSARVGVAPWTSETQRFGFSLEFVPAFFEVYRVLGLALNFEWQRF